VTEPANEHASRCDIVIPVYNGLTHLRPCVESVIAHTTPACRVLLLDDASDDHTFAYMEAVASEHQQVRLLRNPENLGFVKSCNRGIAETSAEYVVLLNSDTIVSPRWLDKMVRCADSDPMIAAASPLSNQCPHMWVKMLPGRTYFEMAELVEAASDRVYPDVTTCEGFCLLLRRRAVEELGRFDEIFSPGYGEESDWCMRAVSRGWRTVAVDDTYIYHRGRGTFGEQRSELQERNKWVFHGRWGELYKRDFEDFKRRNPIGYVRERIAALAHPGWFAFDTPPKQQARAAARSPQVAVRALLPGVSLTTQKKPRREVELRVRLPIPPVLKYARSAGRALWEAPQRLRAGAAARQVGPRTGQLRVAFLLPVIHPYGGVISVLNIANEMILQGVDVKLLTMSTYNSISHPMYTEPISFAGRSAIVDLFPDVDVAVATQWETVDHICRLAQRRPRVKTFYFVQGYEVVLVDPNDAKKQQEVISTYSRIERKVVKTEYLREQVLQHDPVVFRISPGMELDSFYPRSSKAHPDRDRRLLAMIRPDMPWRGFDDLCRVFEAIHQTGTDVEFVLFGSDDLSHYADAIRFPFTNCGRLSPKDLPELYSSCAIFCDFSHSHGFGRTGVEAMACGSACVLTESGGVSEYAVNGWNALLRPVGDHEGLAQAVTCLLTSPDLRRYLERNGLATVRPYSDRVAATQMLDLFRRAVHGDI